jgi:DNA-binding MarR family transcriptional regulator
MLGAYATATDRLEARLAEASLPSLAWFDVLSTIHGSPEQRLRHFELAEEMVMSRSGLSRLVDRIEAAGLIERQTCPNDRRGQHLAVTVAGEAMLTRMIPAYAAGIAECFTAPVGPDLGVVTEALGRVEAACRRALAPCPEATETAGVSTS